MEGEDEGEGETKCKGTKQMGQNEWDEVNVGRNDRVLFINNNCSNESHKCIFL